MATNIQLNVDTASDYLDEDSTARYQSGIGALMFLMVATRPDIAFTLSILADSRPNLNDSMSRPSNDYCDISNLQFDEELLTLLENSLDLQMRTLEALWSLTEHTPRPDMCSN